MATYKIVSHGGTGLPLNVYGTGTITSRRNVCIWTDTGSVDQQWAIDSLGSNQTVRSVNNQSYMLNANRSGSTWNCDVYTLNADCYVNFISLGNNVYINRFASIAQIFIPCFVCTLPIGTCTSLNQLLRTIVTTKANPIRI